MISDKDQKVSWVELFFDLVFVFAVTQIVVLLHHDLNLKTIGQSILIFWLVWWSWTQFTWTLNKADTTHAFIEFMTLLTTAVAFLMAISIPGAFGDLKIWFAIPYILTRLIGLYLQTKTTAQDNIGGLKNWFIISISGLASVLIGALLGDNLQFWFWGLAIILDFVAAIIGSKDNIDIFPEHFVERHGLIIIIALGESLIVAAGGAITEELDLELIGFAMLAVAMTCGLWWSYFVKVKPILDNALEDPDEKRSELARDVFSLFHFPMLAGIISYTLAIEEAILHPSDPLSANGNIALSTGLLLFLGATSLAVWRSTGYILIPRIILVLIISVVIISEVLPIHSLVTALLGIIIIVIIEQISPPQINVTDN